MMKMKKTIKNKKLNMNNNFKNKKTSLSNKVNFGDTTNTNDFAPFDFLEKKHISTSQTVKPAAQETATGKTEEKFYICIPRVGSAFKGTLSEIEYYINNGVFNGQPEKDIEIFELKSIEPVKFKLQTKTTITIKEDTHRHGVEFEF